MGSWGREEGERKREGGRTDEEVVIQVEDQHVQRPETRETGWCKVVETGV